MDETYSESTWLWKLPYQLPMIEILKDNFMHFSGRDILDSAYGTFWDERFWLPPNKTWADLYQPSASIPNTHIARPAELAWVVPLFMCIMLFKMILTRLSDPIGRKLGLKESPPSPPVFNSTLEQAYRKYGKILPGHKQIHDLAKEVNWCPRKVERWWRKRKTQGKPSALDRWNEATWCCVTDTLALVLCVYNLWDKPWLWEPRKCWKDIPSHHVSASFTLLYMYQLSMCLTRMLAVFTDYKRKDWRESMVHHFVEAALIGLSWCMNVVRFGLLLMFVHNATAPWFNAAKVAKYAKFHKTCDVLFAVFAVQWFILRLYVYPFILIWCTLFEAYYEVGVDPNHLPYIYYVVNGLLLSLLGYHLILCRCIFKMLRCLIVKGQVVKDERSDTEIESSSNEVDKTNSDFRDND